MLTDSNVLCSEMYSKRWGRAGRMLEHQENYFRKWKTKWENFTETICSPQCYCSSLGMIYCPFISTTHSIFSSLLARISTGLVALTPTSGVSRHSSLRGLHSQLFPLLFCIFFLFFLIHWFEEANMARRTILFLV